MATTAAHHLSQVLGLALLLSLVALAPSTARAEAEAVETGVTWERDGYGEPIRVEATRGGPDLERAQAEVQAVADRLDALRTTRPHVAWRRIAWQDDRVIVEAVAESGLYANVAMGAVRSLYPERETAGSGARPRRGAEGPMRWEVRVLVHRP